MARRKSNFSIRTVGIFAGIIIAVSVGYLFISGSDLFTIPNIDGFYSDEVEFTLQSLLPNNAVNCFAGTTSIEKFTDGTSFDFGGTRFTGKSFNPLVQASLISSAKDKAISSIEFTPQITCDLLYTQDKVNLVGGTYKITITATDSDGATKTVTSTTRTIIAKSPLTDGSKGKLGTPFNLPTSTVTAKQIQDLLPNAKLYPEFSTFIKVTINILPEFTTTLTGTGIKQTANIALTSQFVAKVISPVAPSTTTQGTIVKFASQDPILPIVYDKASTTNTQASITFKGELDKWSISEGFPYVDIFSPNGVLIHSKVGLSSTFSTSGDITTFKRSSYSIGDINTLPLGSYKVVLHSANDIRKSSAGVPTTATLAFTIKDSRTTTGTTPVLSECPSSTQLSTLLKSLTDSELQLNLQALNIKLQEGSLSTCEKNMRDAIIVEINRRGVETPIVTAPQCVPPQVSISGICKTVTTSPNCTSGQVLVDGACKTPDTSSGAGTDDTITVTLTSTPKAFMKYDSKFTSISTDTNRDCNDFGKLPAEGIELAPLPLQLFSIGEVKCSAHRWVNTILNPVIDFGSSAKDVVINANDVRLKHQIHVSLNQAFPEIPTFDCIGGSATEPRECLASNFGNATLLPTSGLDSSQVVKLAKFTDPNKINTEFSLSEISVNEQQLTQLIVNSGVLSGGSSSQTGVALKEGDNISFLVQVDGSFKGTNKGTPLSGFIGTLTYSQNFAFNAGAVKCDPISEYYDVSTKSCKTVPVETCDPPLQFDATTNSCVDTTGGGGGTVVCSEPVTCEANENKILTGNTDSCGFFLYECQNVITGDPSTTEDICTFNCPTITTRNPNGGCNAGYVLNSLQQCQRIGSLNPTTPPNVTTPPVCTDPEGNCPKAPIFQLTGTTLLGVIVFVVVIIILLVVAVIIRRRRGGGGIIP